MSEMLFGTKIGHDFCGTKTRAKSAVWSGWHIWRTMGLCSVMVCQEVQHIG